MNFEMVKSILPQHIPFLMIDKVKEIIPGKKITCIKNISGNDLVFLGHFPNQSIFPGVLITESMAQASILLFHEKKQENSVFYLTSTKLRFLVPVVPGDQLVIHISTIREAASGAIVEARAEVEEKTVAKGELSFAIQTIKESIDT